MKRYRAPWSTSLIVMSLLATTVCVGITLGIWLAAPPLPSGIMWLSALPLGIIIGCALFTIRGYTIVENAVLVHRLVWTTRLPRTGLQSVRRDPNAMRGSIRTWGNGGFFSFTGWYRNRHLGAYRAFVTDPSRAVVLYFPQRTIVVSPGDPEEFVRDMTTKRADRVQTST